MENNITLYNHSEDKNEDLYYSISDLGNFANNKQGIERWNNYLIELKHPYKTGKTKDLKCNFINWKLKNAEIKKTT